MVSPSEDSESSSVAAAEEAAVAASFLLGEPALQGASCGEGTPAAGSPQGLRVLQLLAAPPPAPPSPSAVAGREPQRQWWPGAALALQGSASSGGVDCGAAAPAGAAASGQATAASPVRTSSLRLHVVRSDEQEALERAMAELERRCVAARHAAARPWSAVLGWACQ